MDIPIILLRFFITFIFSVVFGLERQRSHKPIGFGTFIFVSLGSCGLAIVATMLNPENPLPLLGAIITGIGFLGAGALIKTTDKIFGFTSAASIWLFSIIGTIIGIGEYLIGSIIYALLWVVIFIDKLLEKRGIGSYQKKVVITSNKPIDREDLISALKTKNYNIVSMDVNMKSSEFSVTIFVKGSKSNINDIPKQLFKSGWVESFKME